MIKDQEFIDALKKQKGIILPLKNLKFIENKEFDLLSTKISYIIINGNNFLFKKEEGNNADCYFVLNGSY
jgi:hypothetical protein